MGTSSPEKGIATTQFLAYVYYGQTAGWMKTPLGTEVDLIPCHIVLDGDPAPPRKGHSSLPLFRPCLLWPRSPISAAAELLYKWSPKKVKTCIDKWNTALDYAPRAETSHFVRKKYRHILYRTVHESSAVAEMVNCLSRINIRRKVGGGSYAPFRGRELDPHLI